MFWHVIGTTSVSRTRPQSSAMLSESTVSRSKKYPGKVGNDVVEVNLTQIEISRFWTRFYFILTTIDPISNLTCGVP